ncbi:MAG: NUDIX hydrolase [Deltaproteobacteria bacterium]
MRRYGERIVKGQRYQMRPGAYAILPRDGAFLVTFQAEPEPEFQLPGGGVDPGESLIQALHREVYEETGWHIGPARFVAVYRRFAYMPEYDKWAEKIAHVFIARPTLRMGPPSEPGHTAMWLDRGEMLALLSSDGDRSIFERYIP